MSRLLYPLAALVLAVPTRAQGSSTDARAAVPSPLMLARGDAGVALADAETALFYNPAHLGQTPGGYLTVFGATVGSSTRAFDVVEFYEDQLSDAADLPDEELEEVEERALDLLDPPITLRATAHLPAFAFRAGTVGVGFGAFVQETARAQALDTGGEYPTAVVFGQADGIVALSGGAAVPGTDLTLGLGARYIRRYVSAYSEAIDEFDTPPLLYGSTVAFDVGALYATPVGGLTAGLALYDLVGGGMSYEEDDFYGLLGDVEAEAAVVEGAQELLEEQAGPSLRLGAAYELPPRYLGQLSRAVAMADWVSASTTSEGQSLFRKLRLGAEGALGPLRLRVGVGQGYPSLGVGVDLLALQFDYALYGRQEGLEPGDGGSYAHLLQLRLGR